MSLTIREVARVPGAIKLKLVAGRSGLTRQVERRRVQKPALALAGYLDQIEAGAIQVFGNAEVGFLDKMNEDEATEAVRSLCEVPVAGLVVANGNTPPAVLRTAASREGVALFETALRTASVIRSLNRFLEAHFAPETSIHGVLMRMLGLGVLLRGRSGIGKSEAGLALLNRGHRLVADDVVRVREAPRGILQGRCAEGLGHHMEIRGLGVLNVEDLFGHLATVDESTIDLSIELLGEDHVGEPDRLGIEDHHLELLGIDIPEVQLQLRPGRDIATLVEVAARNQLLKMRGIHGARRFVTAVDRNLQRVAKGTS